MESFICKWKLYVADERLEIKFLHEILLTVTCEPCTRNECGFSKQDHISSPTENAFGIDGGHVNLTLYNSIYTWYKMSGIYIGPLDEQQSAMNSRW